MRNHIITNILLTTAAAWSIHAVAAPQAPAVKVKPPITHRPPTVHSRNWHP